MSFDAALEDLDDDHVLAYMDEDHPPMQKMLLGIAWILKKASAPSTLKYPSGHPVPMSDNSSSSNKKKVVKIEEAQAAVDNANEADEDASPTST